MRYTAMSPLKIPPSRASMRDTRSTRVRFGAFELDLKSGELCSAPTNGTMSRIVLARQPFYLLLMFIERDGTLLTREEIRRRFWPNDTIVEFDHSINVAIGKLRRALGDPAEKPEYIATVASRGYRLMVPVEWIAVEGDSADEPSAQAADGGGEVERATTTFQAGQTVSHYRVLEMIGSGGMGVVYRAEDIKLGRPVAIKFLPNETVPDARARQRFEREAQAASSLNHPNICTVYEFGEHEGHPFLVMELLQGKTLRDRLSGNQQGAALPLEELLDIAVQVRDGLEAAHERGIIHLDFGLAKLLEPSEPEAESGEASEFHPLTAHETGLSRVGLAMGTAGYMSPEQVRGEKLDTRTDLFSFGLVLYEMATGRHAFGGETAARVHDAIVHQPPVRIRELNSNIPPRLEAVISAALEKDRGKRCQSAAEMRADLQRLQRDTDSGRSAVYRDISSDSQEVADLKKSHKRALVALMGGACVIAAAALGLVWRSGRHPPAAESFP